jgi:hypothetical protein
MGAPVVTVAPPPALDRPCAIPLLPVKPKANSAVRHVRPANRGIIGYVDPPAPACDSPASRAPIVIRIRPKAPR